MNNYKKLIKHNSFLITGGTGSFGKYASRFLLENDAKQVTIFSRDEDKQYSMQFELQNYKDRLYFFIGDVRDREALKKATAGIDIVFHAAALKQIPSTEYNILEAVKTNILGAQNVVDACIQNNVKKAIAISTDKAVEPTNTMGFTKGLQERIFILGNKSSGGRTKFALTRYGNVLGSRGSVIPQFKKQLDEKKSIDITQKDMTRFVLTLHDAIQLVMLALDEMVGGEVFIPQVKAIKIRELAEVMMENLKNKKITEIGVRPGEKIHETLISITESARVFKKSSHFILLPQIDLEHTGYGYDTKSVQKKNLFTYTSETGPFLSKKEIRSLLRKEKLF